MALLSQALVAFTIELDNEFEHRMPHRTTREGGKRGPWLGSPLPALLSQALLGFALQFEQRTRLALAISANVVRVLGEEPVRPADVTRRAGVSIESVRMAVGYLEKRHYYPMVLHRGGYPDGS